MTTKIRDLVARLSDRPKPILCLDTCDFLDALRGVKGRNLSSLRSFVRIQELDLVPDRLDVVITYLVEHEWQRNHANVKIDAMADLGKTNERYQAIEDARVLVGLDRLSFPEVDATLLIEKFVDVAKRTIDRAVVLDQDRACIDRALDRLMNQRRPSHKKQIKDSIHLEHYLELAKQLRSSGFAKPCLFVSSNKADFWAESGTPRIHPDLESDLNAAGLTFFARLEEAIPQLGI